MTDLTPTGTAAVRLAATVVRIRRERDHARAVAVALEQELAEVRAAEAGPDSFQWLGMQR